MKILYKLFFTFLFIGSFFNVNAQTAACNLTGGSVYVGYTAPPIMMNATVNGMSQYSYSWTNGASANQNQFYSGWCVTITDLMTGCDTTICESCIPTGGSGMCPMIYDPVCGCDGTIYSNDCIAMQNGIFTFTSAIGPNGQLLPCTQPSPCTVEINNGTVDIEICDGDTVILEATIGFDTYIWTEPFSGASLGTNQFIIFSPPVVGVYSIIVIATDSSNCVDMDTIEVIVNPETPLNPMTVPNPPEICLGDSVVIEVNTGFVNYWWNTNNPLDQNEDRVVVFPTQDFTYVVEALDINGCESREEIQVYVDTCTTSIINLLSAHVNIYPNPSNAEITIRLTGLETFDLEIYDVLGNQVYFEENVFNKKVISKSILSSGTYLIKIKSQEDAYFGKLVFY